MSDLHIDRMALHEAIRQLVADGDTFPGDIADRVIAALPLDAPRCDAVAGRF